MLLGLLLISGGCASAPLEQPPATSYMKSTVGTADELSPQAPGEARNIRKVGNQWTCEVQGKTMVYDEATRSWAPKPK
jgi:hypothetical protein